MDSGPTTPDGSQSRNGWLRRARTDLRHADPVQQLHATDLDKADAEDAAAILTDPS